MDYLPYDYLKSGVNYSRLIPDRIDGLLILLLKQKIYEGENKTFHDYKNKIKLIGLGAKVMRKLGLEKRLFR